MKKLKTFEAFLNENVDSTQIANQIKAELEEKGLKGVFGKGNGPDKVLVPDVDFAISLENMTWGIGTYVYLKNTPENQSIAKEIYNTHGGDYSQSFQQGQVVGVTGIGYNKA